MAPSAPSRTLVNGVIFYSEGTITKTNGFVSSDILIEGIKVQLPALTSFLLIWAATSIAFPYAK